MSNEILNQHDFLVRELAPETALEQRLLADAEVCEGMMWGTPRYGHPEGEVYKHVKDVLNNIDLLKISAQQREQLRLIAFIHDAFKYKEDRSRPRNWNYHHAVMARRFMDKYTDDKLVLTIIQWHDEAYYIWRDMEVAQKKERAQARLERLLDKLDQQTELYYYFFFCDSNTGDKNPAPVLWVEENLPNVAKYKKNTFSLKL